MLQLPNTMNQTLLPLYSLSRAIPTQHSYSHTTGSAHTACLRNRLQRWRAKKTTLELFHISYFIFWDLHFQDLYFYSQNKYSWVHEILNDNFVNYAEYLCTAKRAIN